MSASGFMMPDGRTAEKYMEDYLRMLAQIASGDPPTDRELSEAPLVFSWLIDEVDYGAGERHRHIFGYLEGHPFIPDGNYGRTSPLLQLDSGMTWARCRSRVYRLREPVAKWLVAKL